jgi:hypothetical protein
MSEEVKEEPLTAAKMLEELKRENGRILQEHKREIEAQYERQMQEFLQRLAPPPRNTTGPGSPQLMQATNVLEALKGQRPAANADDIDDLTQRFHAQSQSLQNPPEIRIYEGDKPRQLIRASMEGTKEAPVVLRKSTQGQDDSEFLASMAKKGAQRKNKAKDLPVSLQNNPLSDRVAPPEWQKVIDAKKEGAAAMKAGASKDAVADKAAAKAAKAKKEIEEAGAEARKLKEKDSPKDEDEEEYEDVEEHDDRTAEEIDQDRHFSRFDDATQFMLKKTAFLINDSDEALYGDASGSGANVAKIRKKRKAAKKKKAPSVATTQEEMYGTVPPAGEHSNTFQGMDGSPTRNVLVSTVEVGSPVVAVGGGDGEVDDEQEQPYHPDYVEHVYREDGTAHRVNDYEYEADPHVALQKSDWENEIARHILSVYASDKSKKDIKTSKAIMSMVDVDQKESNLDEVLEYIRSEDGLGTKNGNGFDEGNVDNDDSNEDRASIAEMVAGGGSVAEEGMGDLDDVEESEGEQAGNLRKSTKKPKAKRPPKKKVARNNSKPSYDEAKEAVDDIDSVLTEEERESQSEMVTTAAAAGLVFKDEASFTNHSKYRSCITVRVGRTGNGPGVSEYNPGDVISIRGSPRVFPIWFVSSGEIYSNWARLPGGEELQAQLANLYEKRRFKEYLNIIEKIIDDMWRDRSLGKIDGIDNFLNRRVSTRKRVGASEMAEGVRLVGKDGRLLPRDGVKKEKKKKDTGPTLNKFKPNDGNWGDENPDGNVWDQIAAHEQHEEKMAAELSDDELISLWGQLILCANAFGILCVEKKAYDVALEILNKAEKWSRRHDILPKKVRCDLTPHILDAMALYFYKRGKLMSAMSYTKMALKDHEELENIDFVCIGKLHQSAILTLNGDFKDAHKLLFEVLAMVEDGRLSMEEATPRQLCLVSIAYHNLAVVQMKLLVPDLAAKNSQNARKIARLCLSFSNRWMQVFEWTHEVAMEDIKFQLTHKPAVPLNTKQLTIIKELTTTMYDPNQS